jgi:cell division protein FtsQ
MKKLKNILLAIGILSYLIVVLGLTGESSKNRICNKIDIHITDSMENCFITSQEVLSLVLRSNDKLLGYPIGQINSEKLEITLKQHPSIKRAEVFVCADGSLNIDIEQRKAILRIIDHNHESYYLSADGVIIPWSEKFTMRVPVANGYIMEDYDHNRVDYITQAGEENRIRGLYDIAKYIDNDPFWKAQIEQIYVDRSGELELIPRVGPHIIQFGYPQDVERKFQKLLAFYQQGLSRIGWNRYETINLKYEGQIVCTLR